MGKSLFPLNPHYEDDIFEDPDKKFKSLPYSKDIPEIYTEAYKTPPFTYQFMKYQTCRQKSASVGFWGFLGGWVVVGQFTSGYKYGRAVTRWRALWINLACGIICSAIALVGLYVNDLACSPLQVGRRRGMFMEETVRHALNAKYGLYENVNRIMMSKERITRQEFFEVIVKTYEQKQKEKDEV